jgi:hypothetical protein
MHRCWGFLVVAILAVTPAGAAVIIVDNQTNGKVAFAIREAEAPEAQRTLAAGSP